MGTAISDFQEGGRGQQNVGNILQGGGISGATVCIVDVVHDPMNRQEVGGI